MKTEHTYNPLMRLALFCCLAGLMTACSSDDELAQDSPSADEMMFSVGMADDAVVTRSTTAVTTQFTNFRLYGVKKVTGVLEDVFNDYGFVQQADANSNKYWEYATYKMDDADKALYAKQSHQYWDYDASEYRLIAGAPYDKVTSINALKGTLTLTGLKMGDAGKTSEDAASPTYYSPYFSAPKQVLPADFGKQIDMEFLHALCQVRLRFYYETEQEADMLLNGITFGPAGDGLYVTQGDLTISYVFEPTPKWTAAISSYTASRENTPLNYAEVTIKQPGTATNPTTDATLCETSHYMLPTYGNPCIWTLNLTASPTGEGQTGLGEKSMTVNVPASDMQWQPNSIYTYIFMIKDTGLEYIKVIQSAVADWDQEAMSNHSVHNW